MLAPCSGRPDIITGLDVAVNVYMKDWLLGFIFYFHQIFCKSFNSLGQWHIASVIPTDDGLAL
jgi:hypothetical protein